MKTTLEIKGAKIIKGLPKNLETNANSGRLLKGGKYHVIGYVEMPAAGVITKAWNGVAVKRLDTGAQMVVGVNTLLGQSVVYVGRKDETGAHPTHSLTASEKGYKVFNIADHCFTSVNDFKATDTEDNGTVFEVLDIEDLPTNAKFRPGDTVIDDTNRAEFTELKEKQFYKLSIVKD